MLRSVPVVNGKAVIHVHGAEESPGITFNAPFRHKAQLQFYAPLRNHVSMSNVAHAFSNQLKDVVKNLNILNYFGEWFDESLKSFNGFDPSAKIGLFLGTPDQVPDFFYNHQVKIGVFVCESDRIADNWVKSCNKMDLIIVPSDWSRQAFKNSGVDIPIMIVPHGLEPEYHSYKEKKREGKFVFYNTFHASSYCSRKSLEELVRSFLIAFEGRTDVVLRLRTDLSIPLILLQERYEFTPLIEIDEMKKHLTTEEYAKIFSEVHCTVHPSKGEGFGLVPFQSIACETPVIAPHATGMAEYLNNENSISLNTSGRIAGEGVGNAEGTYFSIDEDHLVDRLRYVEANWENECTKVKQASALFRASYQWPAVLKEFTELISRLISEERIDQISMKHLSHYQ